MEKDAGIFRPLLPEIRQAKSGGASVSGAVFNLSTSIIGAGIMSIPATLKVLGAAPALLLIFTIGFLTDVSVNFLLRSTDSDQPATYAGIMSESFGRFGGRLLQICILVTNMGCLITYLIVIGDVVSGSESEGSVHLGVLQQWFGVHWWTSRAFSLLLILLLVLLPLVLLRRIESLRFTSAVSVLLAVVFVVISSVMAIFAFFSGTTESPRLMPDISGQTSFFDLFTAIPVIVTAFTFHFNVHPIRAEMSTTSDMTLAVRISLIICSIIYAAVGFFGYLLFGDSTMPDILSNFDRNSGTPMGSFLNDTVRLSYALHLVLVFPLLNFSLRTNVDGLIFPKAAPLVSKNARFLSMTGFLLGFTYFAAIAIPNIWYFFQFVGSTSAVCLAFIFPGAIVLRDVHGVSKRSDRILAATMIVLAIIASSIAITTNVIDFF